MISVISGYEIAVVALAVIALLVMVVSALVGIATRLFRPAPPEEERRGLRRRSPGRSS
jgi:hypothetical protein